MGCELCLWIMARFDNLLDIYLNIAVAAIVQTTVLITNIEIKLVLILFQKYVEKTGGPVISRRVVIIVEEVQTTFCSLSPKYLKRTADLEFRRKQSRKQKQCLMTSRKVKGRLIIAATQE